MHFVYILYSEKFDSFYIGQTNNVNQRLERHNNGYEKATARYIPWTLKWSIEKPNRNEAMQLERKLKNLSRKRLERFLLKYS